MTRRACKQPAGENARATSAHDIVVEVAKQLGNTPAVCKKAYIHPAVLELGTRLVSDHGGDMQRIWRRLEGAAKPPGLSAAERRLLAFLRRPPRARPD